MKHLLTIPCLCLFSAIASADNFSLSGPGGNIPFLGSGGGGIPNYPTTLPNIPFVSTVNVPHPVVHITGVTLNGIVHTRAGDLHAVLQDPQGTRYNIFVRSGYTGTGTGNAGSFAGSPSFGTSGQTPFPGAGNISTDVYNQDFGTSGTPPAPWPDGNANLLNLPLSNIVCPTAGTWTLFIYDWAAGVSGTIDGWTLHGVDNQPPISPLCFGDGTQSIPCPCANDGAVGHGCNNSVGSGGSLLTASGSPSNDTVVLTASGELNTALSIVIQSGTLLFTPTTFGDGVKCFAGITKRLYVKSAVGGTVTAPGPGDPSILTRSAALGDNVPLGATRYYSIYYRDANPTFCAAPTGNTFNISNMLKVIWL